METNTILDTNIAIGSKRGTITIFTAIEYPPSSTRDFDILFPDKLDFLKSLEIADTLRENGTPIGAIDIILAAMCLNRQATLITADNDFRHVRSAFSDFKLELQEKSNSL